MEGIDSDPVATSDNDIDLYGILSIDKSASKAEIKRAYHKAALVNHPDKVHGEAKDSAEVEFKKCSKAYEILYDDERRHLYDTHGMSAFDKTRGGGTASEDDMEDILAQMFGMGMQNPNSNPRRRRKSPDEEHAYNVTLEDLYKGKTARFASTRKIICRQCKGSGGREKAKSKQCVSCKGQGLRSVGPGLVAQETVICKACIGSGSLYNPKDQCRKCKGERVIEARKVLEIYIPKGSKDGDRINLRGESDQIPDEEPGDIVFILVQAKHEVFTRSGAELFAEVDVTLSEALTGFSRIIVKHLDGRGLQVRYQPADRGVLEPGQVIKIPGEGMPHKKYKTRGNLYITMRIRFPEYRWLEQHDGLAALRTLLPGPDPPIKVDDVDDVIYDQIDRSNGMGADETTDDWDDDDDAGMQPQCSQQ